MSGSFRHDIAGGGGDLIAESVQSPNYATGSAGWQIKKDGSAEFNAVTIRGGAVVDGTALYYGPSPGAGTLAVSVSAASGTDQYGNAYLNGTVSYEQNSPGLWFACQLSGGSVTYFTASTYAGPWNTMGSITPGSQSIELSYPGGSIYLAAPLQPVHALEPGTTGTAETWHTITSGFPAGVSGQIAYTLLPDNWVGLDFQLTVTSGTSIGGGTYFASVPSAYYPTATKMYDVQALEGSNWVPVSLDIDTGGNIHARNAGVTTITQLTGTARYPLD